MRENMRTVIKDFKTSKVRHRKTTVTGSLQNKVLLIAPCGMNCGICMAYLRDKNKCPSCRGVDTNKPFTRTNCKIKNCSLFQEGRTKFCFKCGMFPCDYLKHLDKRYRTKYNMSMIENLEHIKKLGIVKFIESEKRKWICPKCGGTICVHKGYCFSCGS
jgi:hypothetical protein